MNDTYKKMKYAINTMKYIFLSIKFLNFKKKIIFVL